MVILCLIVPHCVSGQDEPDHAAVDASIEKAIRFLVSRQQPSGGWSIDNYGGETTSATSLSIMALMASGYTPGEPQYRDVIRRGVDYVLAHQVENGMLIDRRGHGPMYDHGISTLMLSEVLGMVDEPQAQQVRQALVKAVQLLVRSQDVFKAPRHTGGWRYQIEAHRAHYDPAAIIKADPDLAQIMDLLSCGHFNQFEPGLFDEIIGSIKSPLDPWMVAADFRSYVDAQRRVATAYRDREAWTRMSILNTAHSGPFSTDRTMREYNDDIWRLTPVTPPPVT